MLRRKSLLLLSENIAGNPRPRFTVVLAISAVVPIFLLVACGGGAGAASEIAAAPAVTLSVANLDFGAERVGQSNSLTLTITNSGNAALNLSQVAIGGSGAAAFSLTSSTCGSSLAPGSSCAVLVTFTPARSGSVSATLNVTDNAGNSPQTAGLSGNGFAITGLAHGMFILDPPVNDNNCTGLPASCYSQHLVPTLICNGNGTPVGYHCTQAGAGEPFIAGAAFHVSWGSVNPSNGTFDFSSADQRMQPWSDSGKLVSLVFEPTSFGTTNSSTPQWYLTPVAISSASQTGGIITLQTSADMGFFPGGIAAAPGLEIQITGTGTALDGNGTPANPGIWTVCDHTTAGCQDPTPRTIYAIGSGSNIAPVSAGTVGNPVYGSTDGSTCTSGILPLQWRVNFQKAWQAVIQQAVTHYASTSNVAYLRFGMGVGGQTNPTNGISAPDPTQTACQAQMAKFGFTSVAAPWPDPGTSQWLQVSATWTAFLNTMLRYEHSLGITKSILITISPIDFSPVDLSTPDATAVNAAAEGIGFGNQGLQKSDPLNFGNGQPCYGGDWCANFAKYRGQIPLELQTLFYSDPTNASQTGSLVNLLPFATTQGVQILELYVDDWLCTYDSSWNSNNTYQACTTAGYPGVFSAAAAQIN